LHSEVKAGAIPELRIQFTCRKDGSVILRCIRRDGTATWERHENNAGFYAFHDLRHFAVETTLGYRTGFYGLIADGWDIADTNGKGKRGRLDPSSILVEHIVGLLERERAGGVAEFSSPEFNALIFEMSGIDPHITEAQLANVRRQIQQLHERWVGMPAGSTLELGFSRD